MFDGVKQFLLAIRLPSVQLTLWAFMNLSATVHIRVQTAKDRNLHSRKRTSLVETYSERFIPGGVLLHAAYDSYELVTVLPRPVFDALKTWANLMTQDHRLTRFNIADTSRDLMSKFLFWSCALSLGLVLDDRSFRAIERFRVPYLMLYLFRFNIVAPLTWVLGPLTVSYIVEVFNPIIRVDPRVNTQSFVTKLLSDSDSFVVNTGLYCIPISALFEVPGLYGFINFLRYEGHNYLASFLSGRRDLEFLADHLATPRLTRLEVDVDKSLILLPGSFGYVWPLMYPSVGYRIFDNMSNKRGDLKEAKRLC
jgi:hypothetical protein